MRKLSVFWVVGLVLLLVGAPAANAGEWYVGGSLGQTSADLGGAFAPGAGESVDDSDTGFKVFGGYNIVKFLSVEASWVDVAGVSVDEAATASSLTAEADGFSVEAVGIIPFSEKFEAFAKAGLYKWDGDMTASVGGQQTLSANDDGTDPIFGIGIGWNAFSRGQLRLEAERYSLNDLDVDMISAGFAWHF